MNQREKFEAWGNDYFNYGFKTDAFRDNEYEHEETQMAWEGWQAALAALTTPPVASGALEDERAAFEADTLDLYPSAKFNRFPSGTYTESHIEAQWGAWQRRAKLAAAAAPNAALAGKWQLIGTAPKDGSMILLGRAEDESCDRGAICTPGRWHEEDHDGPDNMGHDAGFMDIEYQEFSWGRSFGNPDYMGGAYQPTHWMPLPDAP